MTSPTQAARDAYAEKDKKGEGRYFWLKLPTDFFQDKAMKRLRRYPGGAENLVVVLKILLLGVSGDNRIYYDGVEDSFAEEIALSIDERPESVEAVLQYLIKCGWLVQEDEETLLSVKSEELTGSISARTERWRRQQARDKAAKIAGTLPDDCRSLPDDYHREEKNREEKSRVEIEKILEGKDLKALFPDAFKENESKSVPSLSEVQRKAEANHFYAVSPESFYSYFTSLNWSFNGVDITSWGCLYTYVESYARQQEEESAE